MQKRQQLDDFILGMVAHSDAVTADLATAGATMRGTLAALHSHTVDLLRFFESHSYAPPQAVSAALNKAAAQASLQEAGGAEALPAAGTLSFGSAGGDGLGAPSVGCTLSCDALETSTPHRQCALALLAMPLV